MFNIASLPLRPTTHIFWLTNPWTSEWWSLWKTKTSPAKWIHLAAVGEKTSETPFTLKSAAHAWGLCSSSEAFHKNTIHICTQIRREYPKPRPWVLCTQGRDCEKHRAFIVEGNASTPTWQNSKSTLYMLFLPHTGTPSKKFCLCYNYRICNNKKKKSSSVS